MSGGAVPIVCAALWMNERWMDGMGEAQDDKINDASFVQMEIQLLDC